MVYRIFVTESLKNIPQNKYLKQSYDDIVRPKEPVFADDRTPEQIAADTLKHAGIEVRWDGGQSS